MKLLNNKKGALSKMVAVIFFLILTLKLISASKYIYLNAYKLINDTNNEVLTIDKNIKK